MAGRTWASLSLAALAGSAGATGCSSTPAAHSNEGSPSWALSGTYIADDGPTDDLPYAAIEFEDDGAFSATPAGCDDVTCTKTGTFGLSDDGTTLTLGWSDGTSTTLPVSSVYASSASSASPDGGVRPNDLTTGGGTLVKAGGELIVAAKIGGTLVHLANSCGDATASAPATLAQGTFCFFSRPSSAFTLGHIGCGFASSASTFIYGSVENNSGSPNEPYTLGANGGWHQTGTQSQMVTAFHAGTVMPCNDSWAITPYDAMKCVPVSNAQPAAAANVVNELPSRGYSVVGNNCLDACRQMYSAYLGQGLSLDLNIKLTPNAFFESVDVPGQTCTALDPAGNSVCGQ